MIVVPDLRRSRRMPDTSATCSRLRPENGSSRKTISGSVASARAMSRSRSSLWFRSSARTPLLSPSQPGEQIHSPGLDLLGHQLTALQARAPCGKQHRFQRRHPEERLHQLEASGHAELDELVRLQAEHVSPPELHGAPVGSQEACQNVEQARLSRPVGPDDAEDVALIDRERKLVDSGDASERLAEMRRRKQAHDDLTRGRTGGRAATERAPAPVPAPCPKD